MKKKEKEDEAEYDCYQRHCGIAHKNSSKTIGLGFHIHVLFRYVSSLNLGDQSSLRTHEECIWIWDISITWYGSWYTILVHTALYWMDHTDVELGLKIDDYQVSVL